MNKRKNNLTLFSGSADNVTVIIPAYNEEQTIEKVIDTARENKNVTEVIVVDNCSTDKTYRLAKKKQVKVVRCKNQGKGYAMEAGLKYASNGIVAFIDGDIGNYNNKIIEKLTAPIIADKADFVKSTFDRQGGRVTELLAKPLIKLLYPVATKFTQPLSGMIAGRREFFKAIILEKDYAVDIAILIDMIKLGAKIKQVNIGKVENKSKELSGLTEMAQQVANAILKRTVNEAYSLEKAEEN